MKIDRIRLYQVPPRWLFVALDTDAGITGWGEPIIEGRSATTAAAVEEFSEYLLGKDPRRINDIWQVLYRGGFYRGGPIMMSALAGIDQALWDIKGKELDRPVHDLLGGLCRDKMATYSWVGGDEVEDALEEIEKRKANGQRVFKMNGAPRTNRLQTHEEINRVVEYFSRIRERFGYEIDFGIDFHGRISLPMAKVLIKELEDVRPLFIEEPVLPEFAESYARLGQSTSIPLAVGERSYSRFEFKSILSNGGIGILQPDLSHAGGVTECLKIAAMADAYDVMLAPHCPLGPIALAACLTVDFVANNAVLQETSIDIHYNDGLNLTHYVHNKSDFDIDNGFISPLTKPGLGVDIDEGAVIEASKAGCRWKNPVWRQTDGALAEW